MRKLLPFVILAALIFYFRNDISEIYERLSEFSFCDTTIGYYVGPIDPQFSADRNTVIKEAKEAAEIWNEEYGKTLFEYDENANLVIRLVFDERQRKINEIVTQEATVSLDKYELTERLERYEDKYRMLDGAIGELNRQVEFWNSHGGAPPEIFNQLIEQQNKLNLQIDALNQLGRDLESAGTDVNQQIDLLNETITDFNDMLALYPEEGLYKPYEEEIDIYFYDSEERFIHTVAHELGHALGLDHILKEDALMHPTTSDNLSLTDEDTEELYTFCAERDRFEFLRGNWELILRNKIQSLQTR